MPGFIWHRLPAPSAFDVSLPGGGTFAYRAAVDDLHARPLFWRGASEVEPGMVGPFLHAVRSCPDRIVVDVGANTGVFTLLALAVHADVEVVAFEPLPRVAALLTANLHANFWDERAEVRVAAAGSRTGAARFVDPDRAVPTSGRLSDALYRRSDTPQHEIEVAITTLDEELADHRVGVIKIDVEGAEDQVLRGALNVLSADRPIVFFECHEEGPIEQIEEVLAEAGYVIAHLRPNGAVRVDHVVADPSRRLRNFVASHPANPLDFTSP